MNTKKTKDLIKYILLKQRKMISITMLMKLLYLIDYVFVQKTKNQYTIFNYTRLINCPIDFKIYEILNELVMAKEVKIVYLYLNFGDECLFYKLLPIVKEVEISKEDKQIVNSILNQLKGYGVRILTEVVDKTPPVIEQLKGGEDLNKILDLTK